jgi:hypothetical protein
MTCENKVIQVIEKGYDVKEVQVPCGSTSIHGDRLLCDKCLNNKKLQKQLQQQDRNQKADDDWLSSSNWGEM